MNNAPPEVRTVKHLRFAGYEVFLPDTGTLHRLGYKTSQGGIIWRWLGMTATGCSMTTPHIIARPTD